MSEIIFKSLKEYKKYCKESQEESYKVVQRVKKHYEKQI